MNEATKNVLNYISYTVFVGFGIYLIILMGFLVGFHSGLNKDSETVQIWSPYDDIVKTLNENYIFLSDSLHGYGLRINITSIVIFIIGLFFLEYGYDGTSKSLIEFRKERKKFFKRFAKEAVKND